MAHMKDRQLKPIQEKSMMDFNLKRLVNVSRPLIATYLFEAFK